MNKIRQDFDSNVRNKYIKEHPYCEYCGEPIKAETVHHIIPIVTGGDNRDANLISLCYQCHGKIHNSYFKHGNDWKEAQRIGIEKAKKEGKYKGGNRKKINKDIYLKLKQEYENKKITKMQFAKELKVSRPTLDRILIKESEYF